MGGQGSDELGDSRLVQKLALPGSQPSLHAQPCPPEMFQWQNMPNMHAYPPLRLTLSRFPGPRAWDLENTMSIGSVSSVSLIHTGP